MIGRRYYENRSNPICFRVPFDFISFLIRAADFLRQHLNALGWNTGALQLHEGSFVEEWIALLRFRPWSTSAIVRHQDSGCPVLAPQLSRALGTLSVIRRPAQ